ncbi:MAG: hypothetical protein JWQ13_2656 [Ramlibacter sp.]|jgi:hypothetical protein|nr:hypothetical protein [Ramlibacter sp.]
MTQASSPVINPTREDAYWQREFSKQPYYRPELSYDDYSPAYRVGYTAPLRREGSFAALEEQLQQDWKQVKGRSRLTWSEARQATRAAWDRVSRKEHPC